MKHLKTYGPAGKIIVCQVQKHSMSQAKTSYAFTVPLALTLMASGMIIKMFSTETMIPCNECVTTSINKQAAQLLHLLRLQFLTHI